MVIFYRKHYQATTPFWLDWLVLGGIFAKGGLALVQDVLRRPLSAGAQIAPGPGGSQA
jgi:hypothetical protein